MAHLWKKDDLGDWLPMPLLESEFLLAADGSGTCGNAEVPVDAKRVASALIARAGDAQRAAWMLVVQPAAKIFLNGAAVSAGIAQLSEKDEILVLADAGASAPRFYFSNEQLASIEPYPGPEAVSCPRCKTTIELGDPAVRCPACQVWHHQNPEAGKPCWTYADYCAACQSQSTALDAGYSWSPEELCEC